MKALSILIAACVSGCCMCGHGPDSEGSAAPAARPAAPADADPSVPTPFTHEVSAYTAYYLTGPQQGRPPEGFLAKGTKVTLLQEAGSYARVRSAAGIEAWVARDALGALGAR